VLFQGLALGAVASISGAALGLLAGRLAIPVANHFGATFGAFDIPWPAVIAAACLGIAAASGAAFLPARQASRTDVTTALAGRQPDPKVRAGWPIIGAAILAVSVIGSLAAPTMVGPMVAPNSSVTRDFANAWWAVTAVIGAILLTPWLIRTAARLGRWLPLPLRLALRESDRHRARTAPAIAAVMASVSAVTALGIGSSSDTASTPDYAYWQPVPTGTLQIYGRHVDAIIEQVARSTGVRLTPLRSIPLATVRSHSKAHVYQGLPVAVADVPTLAAWGISVSGAQRRALATGKALVAAAVATDGGQVPVEISDFSESEPTRLTLPAFAEKLRTPAGLAPVAGMVISPETARTLHLKVTTETAIADRPASELDIQAIKVAAATASPSSWGVTVTPPGERPAYFWAFLVLAVAGTAAVLIGTFSATALTLTDASADLRTLGEVGAAPRTRRLVAGSHALLIALLGAGLGVVVGLTPGIVAARLLTAAGNYSGGTLDIPWLLFGLLLIVLPLTAGAITAAVSRGPRPRPIREAV
jgi:putative ABC transport system permease protein